MAGSNENCVGDVRPSISQGGFLKTTTQRADEGIGPTRRALSVINLNGARYAPYVATKRDALREKNAVSSTNVLQNSKVHRPLTRNFAAQLVAKQHQPLVEDDEIEMVDADMDIDAGEKKDPLAEYKDDLYVYCKDVEISFCAPPNYMSSQLDINERMRRVLIDWLIEVHDKFSLRPETLYLTVNLMDRFLAVQQITRKKLQLVGVTAMLIASKYEEISAPSVEDLISITDRAFTRTEVLQMEILMVNKLQFDLSIPTVYVFVRRFLEAAKSGNEMERLAFYMIDLCLVEYQMLKFPPSMLAAAAVFTAQCTLGKAAEWSTLSEQLTDYKNHELKECSQLMVGFHRRAAAGKVTAVFRKYNSYKYGYAASAEPAHFLLDPSISSVLSSHRAAT
nr:PREDICTED: G2/mitotic-specific cyclin-2-like [Daucus carota subsp. sativus]